MGKTLTIPMGISRRVVSLVLALLFISGWGAVAQTPTDSQYESPTRTPSGNPASFGGVEPGDDVSQGSASEEPKPEDSMSNGPASEEPEPEESISNGPASEELDLLGVGLLAAVAGIYAALYAVFRVRPGLSLPLQRRALVFLALVGLFFAAVQLVYIQEELLSSGSKPGTYLLLGYFAAGIAVAVCLLAVAYLLRRSELVEVGPLRRSADLDPLTSLYNQPFFRRAASRRIAQAERHGIPLSLAMIDVDDFKAYNDRFGHEAGNTVLRRVAGVLRRSVRADDLVSRYGGEEFVMLLNSEPGEAEDALERIRSQIEARCSPDGLIRRQVTVSIGISAFEGEEQTLESLIEAADEAMYRAKRAGKNRVMGA